MTTDETHPLADLAFELLVRGDEEPYRFEARGIAQLTDGLADISDVKELRTVVLDLVSIAHFLEQKGSPKAGAALLAVAATATAALRDQSSPAALEHVRNRAKSFARFGGDAQARDTRWAEKRSVSESGLEQLRAAKLASRLTRLEARVEPVVAKPAAPTRPEIVRSGARPDGLARSTIQGRFREMPASRVAAARVLGAR